MSNYWCGVWLAASVGHNVNRWLPVVHPKKRLSVRPSARPRNIEPEQGGHGQGHITCCWLALVVVDVNVTLSVHDGNERGNGNS